MSSTAKGPGAHRKQRPSGKLSRIDIEKHGTETERACEEGGGG